MEKEGLGKIAEGLRKHSNDFVNVKTDDNRFLEQAKNEI